MKRILSLLVIMVMACTLFLSGCTQAAATKVGFIYVGTIGDGGWTYAHNEGRLAIAKELKVPTIYTESVKENQDVEKVIADMVDQGCNIIFATSFGYMDFVEKMAGKFPNVKFLHCSGYKTTANMSNYFGKIEEPRYLSGIVAGLKTKTNKIGYVAAFDIPEVVRGINAFTLGVQSVNPSATVTVKWTKTWFDPAIEKEASKTLLSEGVDIVAQHQDSSAAMLAAEEKGAFAVGYNTDMLKMAPKAHLTAPIWNWAPYYVDQVKQVQAGTWKSSSYWEGMKAKVVDLAPLSGNVTADAQAKVDAAKTKILDGSLNVFAGEIKDQSGAVKVAKGAVLSDKDQLSMDWFVQGVVGKIEPKKQ
ncbi:MAG: BMP family ABC transporter substrate-binding protein [Hyphomonadaceae bacterium]|nr:BMP family ABC transporter substrate-binding protein [Clostridia bacterium]